MKSLSLLLLALVVTTSGIMFTDGFLKYMFQISFFCTLGICFFVFSKGLYNQA